MEDELELDAAAILNASFTNEQLDKAISLQTQRVVQSVAQQSPLLTERMTTLYLLRMVRAKGWKVSKITIGISGEAQMMKHLDEKVHPQAYSTAVTIFRKSVGARIKSRT
jgi:hypothetical protein